MIHWFYKKYIYNVYKNMIYCKQNKKINKKLQIWYQNRVYLL